MCDGISDSVNVCVLDPPVVPLPASLVAALGNLLVVTKSGRLNVAEPSPTPYSVSNTAKSWAYVVLDTAAPLQSSHPVGTSVVAPAYILIVPTGTSAPSHTGDPNVPLL